MSIISVTGNYLFLKEIKKMNKVIFLVAIISLSLMAVQAQEVFAAHPAFLSAITKTTHSIKVCFDATDVLSGSIRIEDFQSLAGGANPTSIGAFTDSDAECGTNDSVIINVADFARSVFYNGRIYDVGKSYKQSAVTADIAAQGNDRGLVHLTQISRAEGLWIDQYDRQWTRNTMGAWLKQPTTEFVHPDDNSVPNSGPAPPRVPSLPPGSLLVLVLGLAFAGRRALRRR